MRIYQQGSLYKVILDDMPPGQVRYLSTARVGKRVSKRGVITGFSARSRSRLLRFLARVRFDGALFITLTSRDDVDYRSLVAFCKRLMRRYGRLPVVWRKELQARGVWHYHLIIFSRIWIPVEYVIGAWAAVIGEPGSVSVRFVGNRSRIYHYVVKYIGKVTSDVKLAGAGHSASTGSGVELAGAGHSASTGSGVKLAGAGHSASTGSGVEPAGAGGPDDDSASAGGPSDGVPGEAGGILDNSAITCRSVGRIWGMLYRDVFVFYPVSEVLLSDLSYGAVTLLFGVLRYIVDNGYYCPSFHFVYF